MNSIGRQKKNGAFTLNWWEYYFCRTESFNDHKGYQDSVHAVKILI